MGEQLPQGSVLQREPGGNVVNQNKTLADRPGIYLIGNEPYTSSLLSAGESRLTAMTDIPEQETENNTRTSERVRDIAIWLMVLATLFLLAEWLLWSRTKTAWAFRR